MSVGGPRPLKGSANTFSAVLVAFVAGAVVAAVAVPNLETRGEQGSAGGTEFDRVGGAGIGGIGVQNGSRTTTAAGDRSVVAGQSGTGQPGPGVGSRAGAQANNTFRGVSADAVRIGVATLDSSQGAEAAICPRCSNGPAGQGAVPEALLQAWRRDGLLPVHGRDIIPISRSYSILSAEQIRATCLDFAEDDVLAVLEVNFEVTNCLVTEFGIPAVVWDVLPEETLRGFNGYLHITDMSSERGFENFAHFLRDNGLLDADDIIGIYAPEEWAQQAKAGLAKLGKEVAVTFAYDPADPSSSDPVAVQQFRANEVNVALIPWNISEPRGFQDNAEAQGYRPKYPTPSPGVEALADISYNFNAQNGNLTMDRPYFGYTQRTPPKVARPSAQYCLDEYQAYTGETLDAYDDDTEIRFVVAVCELLEMVRQAMVNAGPTLTDQTFIQGVQAIQQLPTSYHPSMTFGGRFDGLDTYTTLQFKADRSCDPVPLLFCEVGPARPLWVQ